MIEIVVRYLFGSGEAMHRERLRAALSRILPGQEEEFMPTIGDTYRDEGRAEGRAEGEKSALTSTLLLIIENRFGAVSESVETKVRSATVEDLKRWTRGIFNAPSLDAVFADPMH